MTIRPDHLNESRPLSTRTNPADNGPGLHAAKTRRMFDQTGAQTAEAMGRAAEELKKQGFAVGMDDAVRFVSYGAGGASASGAAASAFVVINLLWKYEPFQRHLSLMDNRKNEKGPPIWIGEPFEFYE